MILANIVSGFIGDIAIGKGWISKSEHYPIHEEEAEGFVRALMSWDAEFQGKHSSELLEIALSQSKVPVVLLSDKGEAFQGEGYVRSLTPEFLVGFAGTGRLKHLKECQ